MTQLRDALQQAGFQSTDDKRAERKRIRAERDRAIREAMRTRDESGRFRSVKGYRKRASELSRALR